MWRFIIAGEPLISAKLVINAIMMEKIWLKDGEISYRGAWELGSVRYMSDIPLTAQSSSSVVVSVATASPSLNSLNNPSRQQSSKLLHTQFPILIPIRLLYHLLHDLLHLVITQNSLHHHLQYYE